MSALQVIVFEDEAAVSDRLIRLLSQRAKQRGNRIKVAKAAGDWWSYIEGRIHPGKPVLSPTERAQDGATFDSEGMYWIIDLDLEEFLPGTSIEQLTDYFQARLERDRELAELWEKVKRLAVAKKIKSGLAILAYAAQHNVSVRLFSRYVGDDRDGSLRELLVYLLEGTPRRAAANEISFDKIAFGGRGQATPAEKKICDAILDWVCPAKERKPLLSKDQWIGIEYFFSRSLALLLRQRQPGPR